MIFGKHINRYYFKFAPQLLLGLASLIVIDYLLLVLPNLYQMVVNGMNDGFVVKDGKQGRAVKQITMAGNFLKMLMSVAAVGDDLKFPGDPIGSPSVLVKGLSIAGK